jgi:hypothetical protein
MPFNPALRANGSLISSVELRGQFTGLQSDLITALNGQIAGTARNLNTVSQLTISISDPPSQSEAQQMLDKINEIISAGTR